MVGKRETRRAEGGKDGLAGVIWVVDREIGNFVPCPLAALWTGGEEGRTKGKEQGATEEKEGRMERMGWKRRKKEEHREWGKIVKLWSY